MAKLLLLKSTLMKINAMKVEYVASDTTVTVFENLHLEKAPLYLKSEADVTSGATPFTKPE